LYTRPFLIVAAVGLPAAVLSALALHRPAEADALMTWPPLTQGADAGTAVQLGVAQERTRIAAAGADALVRVRLDLTGGPAGPAAVPTDLVVVLDVSGSMSGQKLIDAQEAVNALVDRLGPADRFAMVSFSTEAQLLVPLTLAGAEAKQVFLASTDGLVASGSTNLAGGLSLALPLAAPTVGRATRLVLMSDGLPESSEGLAGLARQAAMQGSPLTAVGIGIDYDEDLMAGLAEVGTGNFFWAGPGLELDRVLDAELVAARTTVAQQLQLRISAPDGARLVGASGFPTTDDGATKLVDIGTLQAGQARSIWLTYAVSPGASGVEQGLGAIDVRFADLHGESHSNTVLAGAVAHVADGQAALASIVPATWEQAVLTERFGQLQDSVAQRTRAGDEAGAQALIEDYRAAVSAENLTVGSERVDRNLEWVAQMALQVADSFQGLDQLGKQNLMAKELNMGCVSARKVGQSTLYGAMQ
jgi:Ca-activated chloride channel homolog